MRYWGIFFQIIIMTTILVKCQINWTGNWAFGCSFLNRELKNVYSAGDQCGPLCVLDSACTHFIWRNGLCFMKYGPVNKTMAISTRSMADVCGVV